MAAWITNLITWIRSLAGRTPACSTVTLHYHRRNSDYAGWGLHFWGPSVEQPAWESPLAPTGHDEFGIYWVIQMQDSTDQLSYIIHKGIEKDPGPDQNLQFSHKGCEIWLVQGYDTQFSNAQQALAALVITFQPAHKPSATQVLLHYRRSAEDYDNWGLHVWGETAEDVTWLAPLRPTGQDAYGIYWLINLQPGAKTLNYLIHKGDQKDPGPEQSLDIDTLGRNVYLIQNSNGQFIDPEAAKEALLVANIGDIQHKAQAHWLTRQLISWQIGLGSQAIYTFYTDPTSSLQITPGGLVGGKRFNLEWVDNQLSPQLAVKFPHQRNTCLLRIPDEYAADVPEMLKGQYAITAQQTDGSALTATAIQIPGVLDDLYAENAHDAALGISWEKDTPTLRLWAPTAKTVRLVLFNTSSSEKSNNNLPMAYDQATGIWEIVGQPDWKGLFYLYDIDVYVRQEGAFVHNLVTDPYSISLSTNSRRSQIVNLADAGLKPAGWNTLIKPALETPTDIVLYELHLRDFSASDPSVPTNQRGTYLAFTNPESNGMKHLRGLAEAGLTHIHLLPVFDFATVDEDKSTWKQVDFDMLARFPPDSDQQQAAVQAIRSQDAFNWGYDPFHYTTPEGSYASEPDSTARISQFRQMVTALNQIGLRVIMDVVYNHTYAAGQDEKSVLDRVVPGYYHRLDADGYVCNSTCCANTATEHAMMEKLMLDSLKTWAVEYKVDGFRFDLMGHHMVANMAHVRQILDSLTPEVDGIDGKRIYIYGEGWDFGEVAYNARGLNASQYNLAGSGIGTFNDRLRDATRGGNPFDDMTEQGYLTGLYTDPNESDSRPESVRLGKLYELEDEIRVALAGNLADYRLINQYGYVVRGDQISYRGGSCGYTKSPQEHIAYISAHDNDTLLDTIQYKAPLRLPGNERARMQMLGISLIVLSQGVPFLDAGIELLRSKSMERDSYDSGDWFNRLDFSYQHNNWGVGLPLWEKNSYHWHLIQPRLANPTLAVTPDDILATRNHTCEMLQIRRASPLFRLRTAEEIIQRVQFFNTGPGHIPGLIVMALDDNAPLPNLDPTTDLIVVLFNAEDTPINYTCNELQQARLALHPIQAQSADPIVVRTTFDADTHTFAIPGRTTAVFTGQGLLPPTLVQPHG